VDAYAAAAETAFEVRSTRVTELGHGLGAGPAAAGLRATCTGPDADSGFVSPTERALTLSVATKKAKAKIMHTINVKKVERIDERETPSHGLGNALFVYNKYNLQRDVKAASKYVAFAVCNRSQQ
jgi:hypothetical protein